MSTKKKARIHQTVIGFDHTSCEYIVLICAYSILHISLFMIFLLHKANTLFSILSSKPVSRYSLLPLKSNELYQRKCLITARLDK